MGIDVSEEPAASTFSVKESFAGKIITDYVKGERTMMLWIGKVIIRGSVQGHFFLLTSPAFFYAYLPNSFLLHMFSLCFFISIDIPSSYLS